MWEKRQRDQGRQLTIKEEALIQPEEVAFHSVIICPQHSICETCQAPVQVSTCLQIPLSLYVACVSCKWDQMKANPIGFMIFFLDCC